MCEDRRIILTALELPVDIAYKTRDNYVFSWYSTYFFKVNFPIFSEH